MTDTDPNKTRSGSHALNLALGAVAGQVGCLTIVIVVLALLAGLWLDNQFGTRPLLLIGLLVASVPVTVIMMFWVVRQATSRIKPEDLPKKVQED